MNSDSTSEQSKKRHDSESGALYNEPKQPEHSASDWKRFLSSKEHHDHPFSYLPGIMLFIGSLGCGKSTAVHGVMAELDAIMNHENRGRILYYSGSGSDRMLDAYDDKVVEKFDKRSKQSFNTAMSEIYNDAQGVEHKKKKHNIIVVDDGVLDQDLMPSSVKTETPLMRLAMSCRHVPLTILVTSQKHSAIPSFMRANANHVFVFKTKSPAELESIMKDVSFAKEDFKRAMNSLTDPSDFIWCQNHTSRLVKGFDTPLCR